MLHFPDHWLTVFIAVEQLTPLMGLGSTEVVIALHLFFVFFLIDLTDILITRQIFGLGYQNYKPKFH